MAITIDWGTRIISVPKADMSLVDAGPPEIRELDLDAFRLALKALEDDEEGMPYPDTHRHVTETALGSITLARVIELINGFTVTFEDGNYQVDLVGANSNVSDVTNLNQVGLRSYNSAGLIVYANGGGACDPGAVADAVLDENIEGTISLKLAMRLLLSAMVGKSSGGDTSRIKFRDTEDSKDRIDEEVDANGNRLNVTLDPD